ncbi:hypothetical protein PROFUN_15710 [Planoprotostelium fungivorum]|uniref:Uncharacterized protein n=1 Tax=Planoprotostelium fungivorum TaxID=1890364 RepID=A0A2P6MUS3_9EUKA|nr:hypothetical protein PROFUN_15710 [Planoprotostelium fungivorum]
MNPWRIQQNIPSKIKYIPQKEPNKQTDQQPQPGYHPLRLKGYCIDPSHRVCNLCISSTVSHLTQISGETYARENHKILTPIGVSAAIRGTNQTKSSSQQQVGSPSSSPMGRALSMQLFNERPTRKETTNEKKIEIEKEDALENQKGTNLKIVHNSTRANTTMGDGVSGSKDREGKRRIIFYRETKAGDGEPSARRHSAGSSPEFGKKGSSGSRKSHHSSSVTKAKSTDAVPETRMLTESVSPSSSLGDYTNSLASSADRISHSYWFELYKDDHGKQRKYYADENGNTSWTLPADAEVGDHELLTGTCCPSTDLPKLMIVPPPWEPQWSENKELFYHNRETDQVSWELPEKPPGSMITQSVSAPMLAFKKATVKGKYNILPPEITSDMMICVPVGNYGSIQEVHTMWSTWCYDMSFVGDFQIGKIEGVSGDGTLKTHKIAFLRQPLLCGSEDDPDELTLDHTTFLPKNYSIVLLLWLVSSSKDAVMDLRRLRKDCSARFKQCTTLLIIPTNEPRRREKEMDAMTKEGIVGRVGASDILEMNTSNREDVAKLLQLIVSTDDPLEKKEKTSKRFFAFGKSSEMTSGTTPEGVTVDEGAITSPVSSSRRPLTKKQAGPEDTLAQLLEDFSLNQAPEMDPRNVASELFRHPDKTIKKAQERAHKQILESEWTITVVNETEAECPFTSKGLVFTKSFKLSKYVYRFSVKRSMFNVSMSDSLTLTNNWAVKATFRLTNHYEFDATGFFSFYPSEGTIEKGKSVDIKVSYVCFQKTKVEQLLTIDMSVPSEDKNDKTVWTEIYHLPISLVGEDNEGSSSEFWEIDSSDVDTLKTLGGGASASVFLCSLWGVRVAMKRWEFGRLDEAPADFKRELDTLMKLRHPNVVSFIGAITAHPGRACLVIEYLELGGLDTVLKSTVELPFPIRVRMALDAARGMEFVHAQGKVHRDLKSLNLLVDTNFRVKVADFGESRDLAPQVMTKGIGTYLWMSPEVMNHQNYSFAADVFSMGVVLWELYTRILPDRKAEDISEGTMPPLPLDCPTHYRRLVGLCCTKDPTKRPNFVTLAGLLNGYYLELNNEAMKVTLDNAAAKAHVEDPTPTSPEDKSLTDRLVIRRAIHSGPHPAVDGGDASPKKSRSNSLHSNSPPTGRPTPPVPPPRNLPDNSSSSQLLPNKPIMSRGSSRILRKPGDDVS